MTNLPKNRQTNVVVQEFESEILIYDLKVDKAFCLNETSAIIWQLCDGTRTVTEISQNLSRKLNQPLTEDVIWLALDGFKKNSLLDESEQFAVNFNGLSRRQIIKKVGFASLVTLPLISSVVAPSAVSAASAENVALLSACTTTSQCQSGLTCATCTDGTCNSPQFCCTGSGTIGPGGEAPFHRNFGGLGNATNFAECRGVSECEICFTEANRDCCSGKTRGFNGVCTCV